MGGARHGSNSNLSPLHTSARTNETRETEAKLTIGRTPNGIHSEYTNFRLSRLLPRGNSSYASSSTRGNTRAADTPDDGRCVLAIYDRRRRFRFRCSGSIVDRPLLERRDSANGEFTGAGSGSGGGGRSRSGSCCRGGMVRVGVGRSGSSLNCWDRGGSLAHLEGRGTSR